MHSSSLFDQVPFPCMKRIGNYEFFFFGFQNIFFCFFFLLLDLLEIFYRRGTWSSSSMFTFCWSYCCYFHLILLIGNYHLPWLLKASLSFIDFSVRNVYILDFLRDSCSGPCYPHMFSCHVLFYCTLCRPSIPQSCASFSTFLTPKFIISGELNLPF